MSKPSPEKRARQERRARARAARRQSTPRRRPFVIDEPGVQRLAEQIMDERADELATQLVECLRRWERLPPGAEHEDQCPFCGELVLVVNNGADSDVSHREPLCDLWLIGLHAVGAHSPRFTSR